MAKETAHVPEANSEDWHRWSISHHSAHMVDCFLALGRVTRPWECFVQGLYWTAYWALSSVFKSMFVQGFHNDLQRRGLWSKLKITNKKFRLWLSSKFLIFLWFPYQHFRKIQTLDEFWAFLNTLPHRRLDGLFGPVKGFQNMFKGCMMI